MTRPAGPPSWAEKFSAAFAGIREGWSERSLRVHVAVAGLVIVAAAVLRVSLTGWALLALAIGMVIALELINTAIETIVDLVQPDIHPLAKRAKDVAAGAVLVASFAAIAVGLAVLGPPIWSFVSR